MWLIASILILLFIVIFYQDYKERSVYWFLYPAIGIAVFVLQLQQNGVVMSLLNTLFNLVFVLIILAVCYLYSTYKLKRSMLKEVLGIGDILFFIFICGSFSTVSFLVLFVFALLFALLLHMALQSYHTDPTVPLAGYMALFFAGIYGVTFFVPCNLLYSY